MKRRRVKTSTVDGMHVEQAVQYELVESPVIKHLNEYLDGLIIDKVNLKILNLIGSGNFAQVFFGQIRKNQQDEEWIPVAVKIARESKLDNSILNFLQ